MAKRIKKKAKLQAVAIIDLAPVALRHAQLQKFIKEESLFFNKYKKYSRSIHVLKDEDIIVGTVQQDEKILLKKILLYPEAIPFLFTLEGCPQKLFYFILLFELEYKTGTFAFNASTIRKFMDFCKILNLNYKESAIKQAIKELSANNTVLSVKRGMYKMNPMITGSYSDYERTKLINEYSLDLINKKKDTNSIYPTCYTRA
jgi:hypothetical protein